MTIICLKNEDSAKNTIETIEIITSLKVTIKIIRSKEHKKYNRKKMK